MALILLDRESVEHENSNLIQEYPELATGRLLFRQILKVTHGCVSKYFELFRFGLEVSKGLTRDTS